jgi:hypothetical protein
MRVHTFDRQSEFCGNNPVKRKEGNAKAISNAERYGFIPLPKKRLRDPTPTRHPARP